MAPKIVNFYSDRPTRLCFGAYWIYLMVPFNINQNGAQM